MGSRAHRRTLRSGLQLTTLVVFGVVLAVLLIEASLQAAAFWVWRKAEQRHAETPRSSSGQAERVVLCVGDSFTYGEGASAADMAYPSQLQRLLDDARDRSHAPGVAWRTVNDGWPGRNSSELLQRLGGMLVKERPDYVSVLVGTNNRWSHKAMDLPPPRSEGALSREDEGQWQWRFRTLRLLQIAIAGLSWSERSSPAAGPGTDATSHRPKTSPRAASPPSPDPKSMGVAPRQGGLSSQLKGVEGLMADGNPDALATANHMLDDLRFRVLAADDLPATELLVELLGNLRRHQDAIDDGQSAIAKYGKTVALCGRMVVPLALVGRIDEALVQANEAERLQKPGQQEAWLYSARSLVHLRMHNFPGALRDAVLAYSLEPHEARLERVLRRILSHKKHPSYLRRQEEALDLPLTTTMRDRVHAVVLRVLAEAEQGVVKPKLEDDLRRIVALVKESGAQPVLLTYPLSEKLAEVLDAERKVARETHVPIVDLEPVFRELLKTSRREQYFVSDNHCTDAGYHIMADYVMRMLLALEASHAS